MRQRQARTLGYVSDSLCPLHGFLNGLVYGLSARGVPSLGAVVRCCKAADDDDPPPPRASLRGVGCRGWRKMPRALCRRVLAGARALRRRWDARSPWRGSTDWTTDSEESRASCMAPLVADDASATAVPTAPSRAERRAAASTAAAAGGATGVPEAVYAAV